MSNVNCEYCSNEMSFARTTCPHCGRPSNFPNVRLAQFSDEKTALQARYDASVKEAKGNGSATNLQAFEAAVSQSNAVFACPFAKLQPLTAPGRDIYETYYQLGDLRCQARLKKAGEPDWDGIRPQAETAMFRDKNISDKIHYASLSLTDCGIKSYGECHIWLRGDLIAHRTSTFEGNSILFFRERDTRIFQDDPVPPGHRSTWEDRASLAVAKLGNQVDSQTQTADFDGILLKAGENTLEDDFIELHVYGSVSLWTIQQITVFVKRNRPGKVQLRVLKERLQQANCTLKVVS